MATGTQTERVDFVKKTLGSYTHDRMFTNLSISCPYCSTSTRSKKKLAIRVSDWAWHCWKCGKRGRSLIPLLKKTGTTDAIAEFISSFGTASDMSHVDEIERPKLRLPGGFRLLATSDVDADEPAAAALTYLFKRDASITMRDIWYFKFGVADTQDMLNRIVIPSYDASGFLNFYTGRRIDGHYWKKYMNCAASANDCVFNEINVDWSMPLLLVEGPFDLLKCPDNTVPLMGSSISESSLLFDRVIANNTPLVLMLDADARKKANKIAALFYEYDIDVKIAKIDDDTKDPGSMKKSEVLSAISGAVPWTPEYRMFDKIAMIQ